MSASEQYTAYVLELLEACGPIHASRFFGGKALSLESVQFAMIMGNTLYFAVDDTTRPRYEQAGMAPFSYSTRKGRIEVRKYYAVPEDVLTDPDQLRQWARQAVERAAAARRGNPRRKTPASPH